MHQPDHSDGCTQVLWYVRVRLIVNKWATASITLQSGHCLNLASTQQLM